MQEKLRPQFLNVIENFNADMAEAVKDGLTMTEATAIAGAISEAALKAVVPTDRLRCWQAIVKIMAGRFDTGEL